MTPSTLAPFGALLALATACGGRTSEGVSDGSRTPTVEPPSCAPGGDGMTNCSASLESCCMSPGVVDSGTFDREYSDYGGGPYKYSAPATVSDFRLDKYDVTVGRFRQFVKAWRAGYLPATASGKHEYLNDGRGVVNSAAIVDGGSAYEPGWLDAYSSSVAPTDDNLACDLGDVSPPGFATWTSAPTAVGEIRPINCITWQEAYAFCIWDGGFLPTEAEWQDAAIGGSEMRLYPWGSTDPGTENEYVIDSQDPGDHGNLCNYPSPPQTCIGVSNIAPVGTAALGVGRWGQLDLLGDVAVWTLDWAAPCEGSCTNCASLSPTLDREYVGVDYSLSPPISRPGGCYTPQPTAPPPITRRSYVGVRCARSPL